jgi:hypothetical protein
MTYSITPQELEQLAAAVQWAGHFATLSGDCKPGGPAFSSIAAATAILERHPTRICHSQATRTAVNASLQLEHERHVRAAAATIACQEEEAEPEARFLNHYKCDRCGEEWQDEWSCMVDDDCPACGARHMSPHHSEELEAA